MFGYKKFNISEFNTADVRLNLSPVITSTVDISAVVSGLVTKVFSVSGNIEVMFTSLVGRPYYYGRALEIQFNQNLEEDLSGLGRIVFPEEAY